MASLINGMTKAMSRSFSYIGFETYNGEAVVAEHRTLVPELLHRFKAVLGISGSRPQTLASPQTGGNADFVTQLERLVRLRDAGALTDPEFELAKARLLGQPHDDPK